MQLFFYPKMMWRRKCTTLDDYLICKNEIEKFSCINCGIYSYILTAIAVGYLPMTKDMMLIMAESFETESRFFQKIIIQTLNMKWQIVATPGQ